MDLRTEQKREHPPSGMDTGRERHQRIRIRVGVAIGADRFGAGLEGHDDLDPLVFEPGGALDVGLLGRGGCLGGLAAAGRGGPG